MIRGLFTSKAGMLPQQRRLEIAAQNLANINTIGYKRERIAFHNVLKPFLDEDIDENRYPGTTSVDFSQGVLMQTNNPLDVAIEGDGFFVIETSQGELYTRNGHFSLDAEGRLVTEEGLPVVLSEGDVQIQGQSVSINEKGEIIVDNNVVGRLRIVTFDDLSQLEKLKGSYFRATNTQVVDLSEDDIQLRSGYLETSNVNALDELTNMIEINRYYELGQKSIKAQDETLQSLLNQAGR